MVRRFLLLSHELGTSAHIMCAQDGQTKSRTVAEQRQHTSGPFDTCAAKQSLITACFSRCLSRQLGSMYNTDCIWNPVDRESPTNFRWRPARWTQRVKSPYVSLAEAARSANMAAPSLSTCLFAFTACQRNLQPYCKLVLYELDGRFDVQGTVL